MGPSSASTSGTHKDTLSEADRTIMLATKIALDSLSREVAAISYLHLPFPFASGGGGGRQFVCRCNAATAFIIFTRNGAASGLNFHCSSKSFVI